MIGRLVLLLAIGWAAAVNDYHGYHEQVVADKDFILKQTKVWQVLYFMNQPDFVPQLYKEGQEFKITMEGYTNKEAVVEFMHRMEHGFLPRDAIFSAYYSKVMEETKSIFRIMYYAKDFDTFFKTALFCRNRLNPDQFGYAFYLAVIHRPDTKYIRLSPLYEMIPHYFYNAELLEKAHHMKEFGKYEPKHLAGYDAYVIPYNYSNHYLTDEYNYEQRLNYFTEDIGLNTYYFFFRNQYPSFLSSEEMGWKDEVRGAEYLYGHKLLFNRYYLERLSNDLGKVEDYDYDRSFYAGYWPSLSYPNGMHFPSRPWNSFFPKSKFHQIHETEEYETRISQAVDSGIAYTKEGKPIKIYTPEGLNILGNMIEGNADSCNEQYYGSIDKLSRNILGFNLEPLTQYKLQPSALEHDVTSMRDPAFWRMYKRFFHFYNKYKYNQKPYQPEEIQYPEYKIENIDVDKLETYFDLFDVSITNGLIPTQEQKTELYMPVVRQHRLNHKPFNVRMNIEAAKAGKVSIRIFLGPKYNVHMKDIDFQERSGDFYEMDNFIYDLTAGMNKIERNCHDFLFVDEEREPSEVFWAKIKKAIAGMEELKYEKRIFGFPRRLLLPKGRPEGMPFQLFVHVAPVNGEPFTYSSRVFGDALMDTRAMGYPLDRPISEFDFHGPNFFFKDVLIFHKQEDDHFITY